MKLRNIGRSFYFSETNTTRVVIAGPADDQGVHEMIDIREDEGKGTASCVASLQQDGHDISNIDVIDGRHATNGQVLTSDLLSFAELLDIAMDDEA
jgi:hypothetical protein